jgi:hypothetical protein
MSDERPRGATQWEPDLRLQAALAPDPVTAAVLTERADAADRVEAWLASRAWDLPDGMRLFGLEIADVVRAAR